MKKQKKKQRKQQQEREQLGQALADPLNEIIDDLADEEEEDEAETQSAPPVQSSESLYMPLHLNAGGGDSERREYGVTYIQAGRVRCRDGSYANWLIPRETIQAALDKLDGVAVLVDHAMGWFAYPSMRDLAGVTYSPVWNDEAGRVDGGIRLYSRPDLKWLQTLLDEIVADLAAGREVPDVGLSIVFAGTHEWDGPEDNPHRVTKSIDHVESCDIVFGPGAEGRIREVLSRVDSDAFNNLSLSEVTMPEEIQTNEAAAAASAEAAANETNETAVVPADNRLDRLEAVVGHIADSVEQLGRNLERQQTSEEERRVIGDMGLGLAPRDLAGQGQAITGQTDLERFAPTVDWLFGVEGAELPDPQFRRADFIYTALTGDWEWHGVFDRGRAMLASASPVTLPDLAVNAMNKVVETQFSRLRYWRWYELVTRVAPNDGSLQNMQWITYGGTGNLPLVEDGQPYTEGQLGDERETDAYEKRGRYVGITRKMLKNSDIQRIQAVPVALATDAVRTRSAKIAGIFTANSGVGPTLDQDSVALFNAAHNNVAATALGTDTTAWEAASQECFDQTEINSGKKIALFAKYNLVPSALYFQALKNFGYGDGNPTTYNPFAVSDRSPEDPRPVVLAIPDWTDATDWAYLADPNIWPVIMMSYSQSPGGNQHPLPELFAVTSEVSGLMFTNDTMPIKVRDEWAAGVNGYRGIGKRNVA